MKTNKKERRMLLLILIILAISSLCFPVFAAESRKEDVKRNSTKGDVAEKITKQVLVELEAVVEEKDYSYLPESKAQFGFWGVPPNDLSILEIFPDSTHVFGWSRCVEAKNPANIELEMMVDENLPTVFFAQTFCAKNQLAKYLAG